MTPKKAYFGLIGLLCLIIVAGIAAFYFGDKLLQKRSDEIGHQKIQLEAVNTELSIFKASKEMVEKYGFVSELSSKILPESKFQSEVVAELTKFASNNGMRIQTLTFGNATADENPETSQTSTIKGLNGVRVLNASIQFDSNPTITYDNFLNFLRNIEENQRKMQVATLTLTPSSENPEQIASATLTVNIFLRDNAQPKAEENNEN